MPVTAWAPVTEARLPRVRTVLIAVNLSLLVIMAGGLNLLRVYETSLIQETENELNVQAVLLAAAVRRELAIAPVERNEFEPVQVSLTVSSPVYDVAPELADTVPGSGDTALHTAGQALQPVIEEIQRSTLAAIRIVDTGGVIVASSNESVVGRVMTNPPLLEAALTGEHVSILRAREPEPDQPGMLTISRIADYRVHVAHPVQRGSETLGAVVLSRTPQAVIQILVQNLGSVIAYLLLTIGAVTVVAVATALTVSQPVRELVELAQAASRDGGQPITPLDNPMTAEFRELSLAIVTMANRLRERSDYIMEMASHVSHEFKSPVTSIRGAIELLEDHAAEMTEEDRARFFSNLNRDTNRLENLTYQLLALARADTERDTGTADAHEILSSLAQNHPGIDVRVDVPEGTEVGLSADALEAVFGNLVQNSVQAGASRIDITGEAGGTLVVRIQDDGPGVSTGNADQLFRPFFTTHRDSGGTGLGLNIVRALVQGAGGDIEVLAVQPVLCLALTLPLAKPH